MKELIKRMADKKPKPKPKLSPDLTQKERFMEYARKVEADESGEKFEKALGKITKQRL